MNGILICSTPCHQLISLALKHIYLLLLELAEAAEVLAVDLVVVEVELLVEVELEEVLVQVESNCS